MKLLKPKIVAGVILSGVTLALAMTCVANAAGPIQQAGLFSRMNTSDGGYDAGGSDGGDCPYCNGCQGWNGRGIGGCCRCRVSVAAPGLPAVRRYPKVYQNYWADHLYKDPGSAVRVTGGPTYPMVHTPTDTTQLGFYPVTVPYFHYRPEMLPPAPSPNWVTRVGYGRGNGGCPNCQ
ncbi:MAG: hypothetical protein U0903_14640 [Planctomycetales bacterium]